MKEFRADGTLEGVPQFGRVYKMTGEGKLWYAYWTGELKTDLPPYIEKYSNFRGFVTDFLPLAEADVEIERLRATKFPAEELEVEKLAYMKMQLLEQLKKAEQLAHAYFAACPVGEERIRASEVYENIRTATRA